MRGGEGAPTNERVPGRDVTGDNRAYSV
uniref:Uncharacterized protein n=1 Tax=Anguilla anguilla TaxID=7936 RepID=A0A0E9XLV7_ANGAN